jgi:uncharacterized membrane protein YhaH (DUF805 family)
MTFSLAVKTALAKFVTFQGRAGRPEFWYFVLSQVILFAFAYAFELVHTGLGSILWSLCAIVLFLPNLAITIRRLHDVGRTGWWVLRGLVPIVGPLVLLFWYCSGGTHGPNRFGPDPNGPLVANVTI